MGLQEPFKLSETVVLPEMDWQRVPQAWSSSRKTPELLFEQGKE